MLTSFVSNALKLSSTFVHYKFNEDLFQPNPGSHYFL